jgi:hypothetical protein
MKTKLHASICDDLNKLYERKNHDYGDSFGKSFAEYGMAMPCIRLEDKLNRMKALTRNGDQKASDESIDATLMDLANYSIMTLVERRMAEGETPTVEKGDHDSDCSNGCLCTSCVRDHDSDFSKGIHACCTTHGFDCCVKSCPDYQKEA